MQLIEKHDEMAAASIPLIASGNAVSPRIMRALKSDILCRAAEGKVGKRHFSGLNYFDKMENIAEKVIKNAFKSEFAEVRPISGTQANMIIYSSLLKTGEKIAALPINNGSHISQSGRIIQRGLKYERLPLKGLDDSFGIDIAESIRIIRQEKPKIVTIGGSTIIQWQDISEVVQATHEYGGIVIYDASHVAGLIATKCFPNPIKYDVDLITATTCKTIPGPSHAWIFGKKEFEEPISKTVFPGFVSGGHLQESIGAAIALLEIQKYGNKYGKKIIQFANSLGKELEKEGFSLFRTLDGKITDTHQIVMISDPIDGKKVEQKLEEILIFVNANPIPEAKQTKFAKTGVRIGTQELVRLGGKKKHLPEIAQTIKEYLTLQKNREKYTKIVKQIRNDFEGISFT